MFGRDEASDAARHRERACPSGWCGRERGVLRKFVIRHHEISSTTRSRDFPGIRNAMKILASLRTDLRARLLMTGEMRASWEGRCRLSSGMLRRQLETLWREPITDRSRHSHNRPKPGKINEYPRNHAAAVAGLFMASPASAAPAPANADTAKVESKSVRARMQRSARHTSSSAKAERPSRLHRSRSRGSHAG